MQVGDRVEISGLQSRPELNGEEGTVISPINTTGRYGVCLTTSNEKVSIKGHNLAPSRQAATDSNNMSKTTDPKMSKLMQVQQLIESASKEAESRTTEAERLRGRELDENGRPICDEWSMDGIKVILGTTALLESQRHLVKEITAMVNSAYGYDRVDERDVMDRLKMGNAGLPYANRILLLAYLSSGELVGCISSTYSVGWVEEGVHART